MKDALVIDNPEGIESYRLLALRTALKLEVSGLKRSRGPSAFAVVKKENNLKGTKTEVLKAYETILRNKGVLT